MNPHLQHSLTTEIALPGVSITAARGTVLAEPDIHAHNDFEHPNAVSPSAAKTGTPAGGRLIHTFPPGSVTALTLTLA